MFLIILSRAIASPHLHQRDDAMTQQRVTYERTRSIATITLDDGKVNVMSQAMIDALGDAFDQAQWDQVVVVLTGRPGIFSAGFDLPVLRQNNSESESMVRNGFELATRLFEFPFPVVIACTGHALAMGAFLILGGDYRIGAEGPFKIGVNEVGIGLTMPRFGAELCRQRLAPTHFNRAVLHSEIYSPPDAVTAGFLDQVVPAADVLTTAQITAVRLSALDMRAYSATKAHVREAAVRRLRHAIEADRTAFAMAATASRSAETLSMSS